jgi:hypothetical protein
MKRSIASLKERLADWKSWDMAAFELGACLGFWLDFGAPHDLDPWHGVKSIMWSTNPLGTALWQLLDGLVEAEVLEKRGDPTVAYRWNPNYQGEADGPM